MEEGTGRTGPFGHYLAGRPCHLVARGMDWGPHQLEQTGSQWVAAEGESLAGRLALGPVEVDPADHQLGWRQLEHDFALLPACAGSLPPSCELSILCGSP